MAKTFRAWRMENGITQEAAGVGLGVTQREISRWEAHHSKTVSHKPGEVNGKKIERYTRGEVTWPDSWTREAFDACMYSRLRDMRSITSIHSVARMNQVMAGRRDARGEEGED